MTLAARLQQGLAEGEFLVHYQPVVDLSDGRLVALEALVRWDHPERGMLLPEDFLQTAEAGGSIIELGELVLDTVCRQGAEWRWSGADIHVARVGDSTDDAASVRSILALGTKLGLVVVAEEIETRAQHHALKRLGCAFGGGHLFGPPTAAHVVPVERARRIVDDDRAVELI